MALLSLSLLLLPFHLLLLQAHSQPQCPKSFECGSFSFEFPFTTTLSPGCGLIILHECESGAPKIVTGHSYTIMEKKSSNEFLVHDSQLQGALKGKGCLMLGNLSMPHSYPISFTYSPNITLFPCFNQTRNERVQEYFTNYRTLQGGPNTHCQSAYNSVYYNISTSDSSEREESSIPTECMMIQLPSRPATDSDDLFNLLTPNFTLEWNVPEGCSTNIEGHEYDCKEVDGCDIKVPYPTLHFGGGGFGYGILNENSTNKFFVRDLQLDAQLANTSCFSFTNLSLLQSPSISFTFSPNLTFFPCFITTPNKSLLDEHFPNYDRVDCGISIVYYKIPTGDEGIEVPDECSIVQLPLKSSLASGDLFDILTANFTLEWNVSQPCLDCFQGGGQCLTDNNNLFYCKRGNNVMKLALVISIPGAAFLILLVTGCLLWQRKKRLSGSYLLSRNLSYDPSKSDIELFLKNNGHLAPMRYKHSTIKKMTKSFSENLGRGGFGSVYKGQFPEGHVVAVKILNRSNGNGEDFMNEVTSISRTSHVNIVALLGFCYEGTKRALIYDFMPNGSLEKFIGNSTASSSVLGWDKLFEIAVGVARGLEYLHHGCNTRILHLDIKPQNILLDKDLNPRISDFGLSKLCPNRSSIVSMLVGRGTIGYIAPEVFSRNYGGVSYKADVYSYGMLVLEMVGGRRNIDRREVDRTSEIYFPQYIYKQLQPDADKDGSDLNGTVDEEDESQVLKRNLMIVGLWCIQTNPKDRPSMTKVVEMLEGKLGPLEVPSKPYLYSPPTSAEQSFSISESL